MFSRKEYLNKLLSSRNNGLIKIIVGPRRCGKSFLLNEIFYKELIAKGFDKKRIIKFAFDNPDDYDLLDEYYPELDTKIFVKKDVFIINSKKFRAFLKDKMADEGEYILLLDEIQLLEDFVGVLNGVLYRGNADTYVTGSNSYLLSSDIDTKFSGRGFKIELFPLSFKEYIENTDISKKDESFKTYIKYGGLPIVANMNDDDSKRRYLKSTNNETYIKDVMIRHDIHNESDLKEIYSLLSSSIGSLISPTRLVNTFKSVKGKSITDDTIASYIKHFEDSFLLKRSDVYDIKRNKFINSPFKIYFDDIGIRNAVLDSFGNDLGHVIENVVYNELKFRGYDVSVGQLSYSEMNKDKKLVKIDSEVDFIALKEYDKYYIQVCLDIANEEVYNREIKSFMKINDSFKKILIVRDGIFKRVDKTGVVIIDILDFLLSDSL